MLMKKRKLLPDITQPITRIVDQHAFTRSRHEIRVPMYILRVIHPRHDVVQKSSDLVVGAFGAEFGDPDGEALGDFARVGDVVFEVLGGVGEGVVPRGGCE